MTDPLTHLSAALADRYRIERELGHGGMATVYLARDLRHNRRVALKVLRPDLAASLGPERFLREIELAAGLVHPHILPVFDSGRVTARHEGADREFLYYVMPYVEGESLRERLDRDGQLPVPDAVRLLRDVVDALAKSHASGIVHRDIKPDNVMIADRHALVTDFGVAKGVSEAKGGSGLTSVGVAIGTPAYMSPEQAAGDPHIDHRADLYAVGALAYEMLTGRPPFTGDSYQATLAAQVSAVPEPVTRHREQLPPALADLVMRCLAKNPADRWQHAEEMLPVLDALAATPSGALTPAPPPRAIRRRLVRWAAPAALAILAAVTAMVWQQRRGGPPGAVPEDTRSIAVLPFVNGSGNPDDEYFADGMAEELISALGKVPGLRVAARSSAFTFKGRTVDAREVGNRLNVSTVLEGSVRRAGSRIRISAQLVSAADGLQIWSDTYERTDGDAFEIQDEITQAIVGALQLRLGGLAQAVARAGRTDNPVAHDLYLRGNSYVTRSSEADLRRAIVYYEQALAEDPDYALAYTQIAFAYGALADTYMPPQEAFPLGKAAAEQALAIDSLIPEAHAILGYARYVMDFDLAGAEREFERAIALDSNAANTFFLYGMFLCGTDRDAEGQAAARRATVLDPLSQPLAWGREACLYYGRHFEDLVALHPNTADIDSTFFYFENWVAAAYRELGRYDEALEEYRRSQALVPGEPLFGLAVTYARMGRMDDARTILRHIEQRAETRFVPLIVPAIVYASLGDTDHAVALLEEAYAMREPDFLRAPRYPELDDVTRDPRIRRLLDQIGLQ